MFRSPKIANLGVEAGRVAARKVLKSRCAAGVRVGGRYTNRRAVSASGKSTVMMEAVGEGALVCMLRWGTKERRQKRS